MLPDKKRGQGVTGEDLAQMGLWPPAVSAGAQKPA